MERPAQELKSLEKKVFRAHRKIHHLQNRQKELQRVISQNEKIEAEKERALFVDNLQVWRVPNLLKRKLDTVLAIPPNDALRDYLFSTPDVFNQICHYLGPSEYFMFTRTCKSIALTLTVALDQWATQFIQRIKRESQRKSTHATVDLQFLKLSTLLKSHREPPVSILPNYLGFIQHLFRMLRPCYMSNSLRTYPNDGLFLRDDRTMFPMFILDKKTQLITRAVENNVLSTRYTRNDSKAKLASEFRDTHGFDLVKAKDDEDIDYFRYDQLAALRLHRIYPFTEIHSHCGNLYIVQPDDNTVEACFPSERITIFYFELLTRYDDGSYRIPFYDEYECHSLMREKLANRKQFQPNHPSYHSVYTKLETLNYSYKHCKK